MPHAALLVVTSPMLLGPLPQAESLTQSVDVPNAIVANVEAGFRLDLQSGTVGNFGGPLMALNWSLQSTAGNGQDQTDETDLQESGKQSDANSGEEPGNESEIIVEGSYGPPEADPLGVVNETSYRITQGVDDALVEPITYAYRDGLPGPLRDGLGNVVRNLSEPANFLNFLLQLKIGKAFETLGRFAINSTLGVGGLLDIAGKPGVGLPYRRNGFANTLGFYGVDTGAYLFLPITGPTTVRDLIGRTLDQAVLPLAVGAPFNRPEYTVPYFVISNVDSRLEIDAELAVIDSTVDPYAARRDTYLARRARDIALLRGEEPPEPPTILRELENELECGDVVCDGDPDGESDSEANMDPASQISARQLPPIGEALAITQTRTR